MECEKKGPTISRDLRVNQMIRIPQVRGVDEEGAQLGVMPTPNALEMAQGWFAQRGIKPGMKLGGLEKLR